MEFGNVKSSLENIVCGIPQGILGPVLFIININYICNVSNILKFVLFANDTNIFTSKNDIAEQYCETNRELNIYIYYIYSSNKAICIALFVHS